MATSFLESLLQSDAQRNDAHMAKVFAANPKFAQMLYGAKNDAAVLALAQQEAQQKSLQQDALRNLAKGFSQGGNIGDLIAQGSIITGDISPLATYAASLEKQKLEAQKTQALSQILTGQVAPTGFVPGQPVPVDINGQPLNVRNNNPGNMRPVGQSGGFQSFSSPEEGMAAMANDLTAKVTGNSPAMKARFGENYTPTLANIITTWAPPEENDTAKYIDFVSQKTGIGANDVLSPMNIQKIMPAMIEMEGGKPALEAFVGGTTGPAHPVTAEAPSNPVLDRLQQLAAIDPEKFGPAYLQALQESQKPQEPLTDLGKAQRDESLGLAPKGTVENLVKEKTRQIRKEEAEAQKIEQAAKKSKEQEEITAKVAEKKMTEALDLIKNGGMNVGGMSATSSFYLPGKATDADKLNSIYSTLKSVISLDKLMEMKSSSPTGASGLGALSQNELTMLTDSVAALDVELPIETQMENLKTISDILGIAKKGTKNASVDDALLEFMTPEERALFQ